MPVVFPNVPITLGVPPLPRLPGAVNFQIQLLAADAVSLFSLFTGPQWGIFQNGQPVLAAASSSLITSATNFIGGFGILALPTFVADSIVGFDYKQDWRLPTFPVENGGFQSYDKVQMPFDVRVRVSAGGTAARRQALLQAVDAIANSLALFDVVTPEVTYTDCNCNHYDYSRSDVRGVGLITVDMYFTEIRQTATQQFTSTQNPTSQNSQALGNASPQPPTQQESTWLNPGSIS